MSGSVTLTVLGSQPTQCLGEAWFHLIAQALLFQQLLPVLLGLVQGVIDGQLSTLHLVHDAQLHLVAQLKAQQAKN